MGNVFSNPKTGFNVNMTGFIDSIKWNSCHGRGRVPGEVPLQVCSMLGGWVSIT